MNKKIRQKVFEKYNGLCAYTGKPLGDDWQVDHMNSKYMFEQVLINEAHYKNKETSEKIMVEDYVKNEMWKKEKQYQYYPRKTKPHPDCDNISNLLPAIKIVNHYKRSLDLEGFRDYMLSFHKRLKKLPRKTVVYRTEKRKEYMIKIAELFNITPNQPFCGKFYFETIKH